MNIGTDRLSEGNEALNHEQATVVLRPFFKKLQNSSSSNYRRIKGKGTTNEYSRMRPQYRPVTPFHETQSSD